mmetsp:Transcript_17115/g.28139  ORF Transcript_17115/g.28139 Transcript_17115/m.28139 type:complete len:324 (+) Transcript_17115:838-1809(+)
MTSVSFPPEIDHTRTVMSVPPDTTTSGVVGDRATLHTAPRCPRKVAVLPLVFTSHAMTRPSSLAETPTSPLTCSARTVSVCPKRVRRYAPVHTSHTPIDRSLRAAVASKRLPSVCMQKTGHSIRRTVPDEPTARTKAPSSDHRRAFQSELPEASMLPRTSRPYTAAVWPCSSSMASPESKSHIRMAVPSLEERITRFSWHMRTAVTGRVCPCKHRTCSAVLIFHTRMVLSNDPLTAYKLSMVTSTAVTPLVCFVKVRSSCSVGRDSTRAVASAPVVMSTSPSLVARRDHTESGWTEEVAMRCSDWTEYTRTFWSSHAVMSRSG